MNPTSIRLLTLDDAQHVYNEVNESRKHLQNLVWASTASRQSVEDFLLLLVNHPDRHLYGIFHNDQFCGCIEIRDKKDSSEIGYWLWYKFRGRGILQNALIQLKKNLFFSQHNHFTAKVKIKNIKSYTILHSIFNMEKMHQDDVWIYLSS